MIDLNKRRWLRASTCAAVAALALVAGCGKEEPKPAAKAAAAAPAPKPEPLKIGFMYVGPVGDAGWIHGLVSNEEGNGPRYYVDCVR